jgi:hypothetical protein
VIPIPAFLCEHCANGKRNRGTTYRTMQAVTKHERTCFFNPEMKACVSCASFTPGKPCTMDDPTEPPYCAKGHDLERKYVGCEGDMTGGLRHGCPDWTKKETPR